MSRKPTRSQKERVSRPPRAEETEMSLFPDDALKIAHKWECYKSGNSITGQMGELSRALLHANERGGSLLRVTDALRELVACCEQYDGRRAKTVERYTAQLLACKDLLAELDGKDR